MNTQPLTKNLSILITFILILIAVDGFSKSYKLLLREGVYTLKENFSSFQQNPEIIEGESVGGKYFRIIQFYELPDQTSKKKLAALGIDLMDYLPNNAYMASIPKSLDLNLLEGLGIRSVAKMASDAKIHHWLKGNNYPEWVTNQKGFLDVTVQYYEVISETFITEQLVLAGGTILSKIPEIQAISIRIPEENIALLASLPGLYNIEPVPEPGKPEDTPGKSLHRANVLNSEYGAGRHYDGSGVALAINDDGFVGPHIDFKNRTEQSDVAFDFTGTHGDMTTGIAGGAGNLDPTIQGMAPGAFLHVRQYEASMPNTATLHINDDVMVFSTSYSNGCNAGYTATTQLVDQEVQLNRSIFQTFSAGNSNGNDCGYGAGSQWGNITGGHKIAKNVIATANLDNDDAIQSSSSRGPAFDGRLKPNIAANGNGQMSTDPNNSYAVGGGTSAASPGVGGVAAQLYQAYKEANAGVNPESGLIIACLQNTAEDLGNPGPDFTYGYGRINGRRAVEIIENDQIITGSVNNGDSSSHSITVPSGLAELRVMLLWTDPTSSTVTAKDLINDLNFKVTDPSSTTYLPWVLDHTPDADSLDKDAVRGIDSLNNFEQVTISNPASGNYDLKVEGFNVPQAPQDYFIVYYFVTHDIVVTYPQGGEGFVPGETEKIRWDAPGDSSFFRVDYSLDNGGAWTNISSTVPGAIRSIDWNVPTANTGQALIRIQRSGQTGISPSTFTIVDLPTNIQFPRSCPDTIDISWNSSGASSYEVYHLGNQYMDSIGASNTTGFSVIGLNPFEEQWFSVASISNDGTPGRRALAVQKPIGLISCAVNNDLEVSQVLQPIPGTYYSCNLSTVPDLEVEFTNTGLNNITSADLGYIVNGGTPVIESLGSTLGNGSSVNHVFSTPLNFSTPGTHEIIVFADLSTDQNRFNDTVVVVYDIIGSPSVTAPWSEDFETFSLCSTESDCGGTFCIMDNGFTNVENFANDDHDWRTNAGPTPSNTTGPSADHTLQNSSGKYLYLEASNGCDFATASLLTPCIDLTGSTNPVLRFWYNMNGASIGELSADVLQGFDYDLDVMPVQSGNQGDIWQPALIDLSSYVGQTINVRVRGTTSNDFDGDIAIDDFELGEKPVASFSINGSPCVDEPITLVDNSSGSELSYSWTFGPGASQSISTSSGDQNIDYSSSGTKEIILIVSNGFGSDTSTQLLGITQAGDVAGFFHLVNANGSVQFNNTDTAASSYFWDFGDGNTSTDMSPLHFYSATGNYIVTSIATNQCLTDTVQKDVSVQVTGIASLDNENTIDIFPNPSNGLFNLKFTNQENGNLSIVIKDIQGRLIVEENLKKQGKVLVHQFDLTKFSKGVYLMEINFNGVIFHRKIENL